MDAVPKQSSPAALAILSLNPQQLAAEEQDSGAGVDRLSL